MSKYAVDQNFVLNVVKKPDIEGLIQLKSGHDIEKLVKQGHIVCLYQEKTIRIFFTHDYYFIEKQNAPGPKPDPIPDDFQYEEYEIDIGDAFG